MLLVAVRLMVPLKYRGKEVRLRVFFGGDMMANLRPQSAVDIYTTMHLTVLMSLSCLLNLIDSKYIPLCCGVHPHRTLVSR